MTNILAYDRLPPCVEEGVVVQITQLPGKKYAHLLLEISYVKNKKRETSQLPFYFSGAVWAVYQKRIKVGSFWRFHFFLLGNNVNGRDYLNAEVVKAVSFHTNAQQTQANRQNQAPAPQQTQANRQNQAPAPQQAHKSTSFLETFDFDEDV